MNLVLRFSSTLLSWPAEKMLSFHSSQKVQSLCMYLVLMSIDVCNAELLN